MTVCFHLEDELACANMDSVNIFHCGAFSLYMSIIGCGVCLCVCVCVCVSVCLCVRVVRDCTSPLLHICVILFLSHSYYACPLPLACPS